MGSIAGKSRLPPDANSALARPWSPQSHIPGKRRGTVSEPARSTVDVPFDGKRRSGGPGTVPLLDEVVIGVFDEPAGKERVPRFSSFRRRMLAKVEQGVIEKSLIAVALAAGVVFGAIALSRLLD